MHVADFHKEWIDLGLIKPQDININILQSPDWYRIDVLPAELKDKVRKKITEHIQWLEPQDKLTRATSGYKGLISFMDAEDKSQQYLQDFFTKTRALDNLRNENFYETFPELVEMKKYDIT